MHSQILGFYFSPPKRSIACKLKGSHRTRIYHCPCSPHSFAWRGRPCCGPRTHHYPQMVPERRGRSCGGGWSREVGHWDCINCQGRCPRLRADSQLWAQAPRKPLLPTKSFTFQGRARIPMIFPRTHFSHLSVESGAGHLPGSPCGASSGWVWGANYGGYVQQVNYRDCHKIENRWLLLRNPTSDGGLYRQRARRGEAMS